MGRTCLVTVEGFKRPPNERFSKDIPRSVRLQALLQSLAQSEGLASILTNCQHTAGVSLGQ